MYLIYKHWYDPLTSMREPDTGYDIVGYVESEEHAKSIVKNGGTEQESPYKNPLCKYKKIELYNP